MHSSPRQNPRPARAAAPGGLDLQQSIVLPARVGAGARAATGPPVRIFVGSAPEEYRAERVLLWSIERARDPDRVYEIHLLRGLPGSRARFAASATSNPCFTVPHIAGHGGRAIYNDVGQVYLADPAELFDLELRDRGYLSASESDTSVMLIDCARITRSPRGALPAEWNVRHDEHVVGKSKLLRYATLHKQPWRPFPERFLYQPDAAGALWLELEREADEAGHQIFTALAPSAAFEPYRRGAAEIDLVSSVISDDAIARLVCRTGSRSVLHFVPGDGSLAPVDVPAWTPTSRQREAAPEGAVGMPVVDRIGLFAREVGRGEYDGVVCSAGLEQLPQDDVPHVVERLFARADRFVFAAIRCDPPGRWPARRAHRSAVRRQAYWEWVFESAARRHSGVFWQVACHAASRFPRQRPRAAARRLGFLQGGPFPETLAQRAEAIVRPRVWVLADHKPGHTTQSEGLAAELGWPSKRIDLEFNFLSEFPNAWTRGTKRSLSRASREQLQPPWPDLVIATGRRTAPIASFIRSESRGTTRTVQMGRLGAFEKDTFDLAVSPAYACLYPDPRRVETAAPVTRVNASVLAAAAVRWGAELVTAPTPRIALLVGGSDTEHRFGPDDARLLGTAVRELAQSEGGSVLATTSRRTSLRSSAALREALGETCACFHAWRSDAAPDENPYLGYLALAEAIVVTGESASMLAEACATRKPVYIFPLTSRRPGPRTWLLHAERLLADAVRARAYARPKTRRDVERPQRGLELLSATLIARGFVRRSGHSERLHRELVSRGLAKLFDGKLAPVPANNLTDVERVADRVRALMGTC